MTWCSMPLLHWIARHDCVKQEALQDPHVDERPRPKIPEIHCPGLQGWNRLQKVCLIARDGSENPKIIYRGSVSYSVILRSLYISGTW